MFIPSMVQASERGHAADTTGVGLVGLQVLHKPKMQEVRHKNLLKLDTWDNWDWWGGNGHLHGMQEVSGSIPLGSTNSPLQYACARYERQDRIGWALSTVLCGPSTTSALRS